MVSRAGGGLSGSPVRLLGRPAVCSAEISSLEMLIDDQMAEQGSRPGPGGVRELGLPPV